MCHLVIPVPYPDPAHWVTTRDQYMQYFVNFVNFFDIMIWPNLNISDRLLTFLILIFIVAELYTDCIDWRKSYSWIRVVYHFLLWMKTKIVLKIIQIFKSFSKLCLFDFFLEKVFLLSNKFLGRLVFWKWHKFSSSNTFIISSIVMGLD